jgi:hypothetical protein
VTVLHSSLNALADQHKPFYEGTSAPGSPATGHYWLDTTALPYLLKRYNGSSWDVILNPPIPGAVPQYASGDWIDPWIHGTVCGTVSAGFAAGHGSTAMSYLVPIYFAKPTTVDALGVGVASACASLKYAKFALRTCKPDGLPGATVAETSPVAMNGSDSEVKLGTVSNTAVNQGPYYVQMVTEIGCQFTTFYLTSVVMSAFPYDPSIGAAKNMLYTSVNYASEIDDNAWTTLSGISLDDEVIRIAARID